MSAPVRWWGHALDVALVAAREVGAMTVGAAHVVLPAIRSPAATPRPGQPPVVLVHGYLGHHAFLGPLAQRLRAEGVPEVAVVAYPSVFLSLESIVDRIAAVAVPLAREHGVVDIVGHSLGAVAVRAWLKRFGGAAHVRRFVSLGGPHAGTSLYRFVPGPLRTVLNPRGDWVHDLQDGAEPVPTTIVRAQYDHQVFPPTRAALPGVQEVVLARHGHNGLLFAPEAHDAVVHALLTADQRS